MQLSAHFRLLRCLLPALLAGLTTGCATLHYYGQSVHGQLELLAARRPIPEVLADPGTPEAVRRQLQTLQAARRFAIRELGLPADDSYTRYADLGRPYVVWSVVATPEFSLEPRTWCFPVFGCMAYHAWFSYPDAVDEARRLRAAGYDVMVAGVAAYSTLGWFDDPLLNTMLGWDEPTLVGLLFHEKAHQLLYVPGDTAFNEAFATTVQQAGVRRWMQACAPRCDRRAYRQGLRRARAFTRLVLETRRRLMALYASGQTPAAMRRAKREIFRDMRRAYRVLRSRWNGYAGYDHWMFQDLNNAMLASVATYDEWVPAFQVLLRRADGDLPRFYAAARRLAQVLQRRRALRRWQGRQAAAQSDPADLPRP